MKFKLDDASPEDKSKFVAPTAPQPAPNKPNQKPHINVIFCIPGREFTANFLQSWTNLCNMLYQNQITFALSNAYSPVVYYARSAALRLHVLRGEDQLPFNGEFTYDYLMWIDSDIVFKPEDFFRLLERMQKNREMQLLSGVYLMADGYHTTIVDKWDEEYFLQNGSFQFLTRDDIKTKKDVFTGVYAGFGWLMVRYGVFESMKYPHFRPTFHTLKGENGQEVVDFSSEDASFFLEMKDKGVTLHVDPTIFVGHEKMVVLGPQSF